MSWLLLAMLVLSQEPAGPAPAAPVENPALDRVKAEINLEKRSEMALALADESLSSARKAYREANVPVYNRSMKDLRESVELARAALREKRKSPKYFKRAEQRTFLLRRHLEDFVKEAAVDDRAEIEGMAKVVEEAHSEFLNGVLRK